MRAVWLAGVLVGLAVAGVPAQRAAAGRVTTKAVCAASLGTGVETRRTFCDVIITADPAASVTMAIPAHTGTATLLFDLHNRFVVPAVAGPPGLAYSRHEATVHVVRQDGTAIGAAAVVREYRTVGDLFNRIGGGGRPGGVKAVAPGRPEAIRFTVPAGVSTVGIVGVRLRVQTRAADRTFDTPGRPVAIVSNLRIQYRPAR